MVEVGRLRAAVGAQLPQAGPPRWPLAAWGIRDEPAVSNDKSHHEDPGQERGPAWTAAADQADAQAAGVAAWLSSGLRRGAAQEAGRTGRPVKPITDVRGIPGGPLGELVARVTARADAGELTVCPHGEAAMSPGPPPWPPVDALVWVPWHPDLLSCERCAAMLPAASGDDDRRCDGCGRVTQPGEDMQVGTNTTRADPSVASRLGHPPALVCCYGLCQQCHRASSYAPG